MFPDVAWGWMWCAAMSAIWGARSKCAASAAKARCSSSPLPLTLAIVDGLSVAVGDQTYILPMMSTIESLRLDPTQVTTIADGREVFGFRDDYLPIVRLYRFFGLTPRARALHDGLVVVVEGAGRRIGLFVDDLLGQQQVVIKSLETNYGHVAGIAAATISVMVRSL